MDKPDGSVIYTQMCNERGGIEADLTIIRLAQDHYYIVTGSGFGVHDSDWIERHLPDDVHLIETTSARAVINICGPDARRVLEACCEEDVSNEAFAFATMQKITIGAAPVRAVRIGYVGELGWELHIPTEFALHVYETLWQTGQAYNISNVGYRAIDSLRLEKGYLYWSGDITPDYSPIEAGLGFRVHLKSKQDFIGRTMLESQKLEGTAQVLCTFASADRLPVFGGETILLGGEVISLASSAGYGHTIGKTIMFGYLPIESSNEEDFELEVFAERYPIKRVDGPLYDPRNLKLKS